MFNFNAAKQFLEIIQKSINEKSLENHLFSHSSNALLSMCLLYELLDNIVKKFYSLSNLCEELKKIIMIMGLQFIEEVDDENFLTAVTTEKDYSGRDFLRIIVELELLDLIQQPKIEAIIKRSYYSDFESSGSLF